MFNPLTRSGGSVAFRAALAAVAIFLLGWGGAADAAVVVRDVNVTLSAADIETFDLDVDLNGTTDFIFTAALVPDPFLTVGFDTVDVPFGSRNGTVIENAVRDGFPTSRRLGRGETVSAADVFSFGSSDQSNLFFLIDAPFIPGLSERSGNFEGQTGFVGLRFENLMGELLFGFAEVTVNALDGSDGPPLDLTIGRVGFNNVPGAPVQTPVPEPASLALFGLTGLGLLAGRRRRAAA